MGAFFGAPRRDCDSPVAQTDDAGGILAVSHKFFLALSGLSLLSLSGCGASPLAATPSTSPALHIPSGHHGIIRIIAPLAANWRVHGHGAPPLGGTRPNLRNYLSRTGPNRMDVSHGHRLFCPPASRRGQRLLALSWQPLAFFFLSLAP